MESHGVDLDWRIRNKCPSVSIDFIYSLRVVGQQKIQNLELRILHLYSGNYQKIFLVAQFLQNVEFELFFGRGKHWKLLQTPKNLIHNRSPEAK